MKDFCHDQIDRLACRSHGAGLCHDRDGDVDYQEEGTVGHRQGSGATTPHGS